MSIKRKVFAAAATLTLAGGVASAGVMTAGPASAATPADRHVIKATAIGCRRSDHPFACGVTPAR